ncbi:roundabout homolog 1-like isoform X4 [Ptychodera flava]|uniref:roundabout homolog 1-like isoform X4 n=1 Tax=Ptychodera flava TaxID=63121 RepID=UPI00396A93C7
MYCTVMKAVVEGLKGHNNRDNCFSVPNEGENIISKSECNQARFRCSQCGRHHLAAMARQRKHLKKPSDYRKFSTNVNGSTQHAMELTTRICYLALIVVCLSVFPVLCQVAEARRHQDDFAPRITEDPTDIVVPKAEPATLNCKAEGQPRPTIQWLKDGQPVETIADDPKSHRTLLPSGSLFFLRIIHGRNSKPDAGVYQCVATNYLGTTYSRNATLEVAILKEEFREEPTDVVAATGDSAMLNCLPPRGYPEPTASWEKDGNLIEPSDRIQVSLEGHLMFAQVRREDAGQYVCIGSNVVGEKRSREATLTVREKPTFIVSPQDITAVVNDNIEFYCTAAGDPVPTVTWSKKDGELPAGRYQILDDNTLKLRHVTVLDEGSYICTGENSVGASHTEAKLSIHAEPAFSVVPRDRVVAVNRIATFDCRASGSPKPAIFWQRDGDQDLLFSGQVAGRFAVTQEGQLQITDVQREDEGFYTCSALSVAGTVEVKAKLTVIVMTDRPPPIIRQGPSNQTLAVSSVAMLPCVAAGNPPPTVRWQKDNSLISSSNPRISLSDPGTLQITDLRLSDTGLYTCIASSESGETIWSAGLTVVDLSEPTMVVIHRTPEPSTFPGQPSKPEIQNVTRTSVWLTWRPNGNSGASSVIRYIVEYYSRDVGSGWTVVSRNVRAESFVVRQLRPATTYIFLVRAVNSHGVSLPSAVSQEVTTKESGGGISIPEAPIEVQRKLNSVAVTVTEVDVDSPFRITAYWMVEQQPNSVFDGFVVKCQATQRGSENIIKRVSDKKKRHLSVDGLRPLTEYSVIVLPYKEDGRVGATVNYEGVPSRAKKVKMPTAPPIAAPRDVTAKSNGSEAIKIQWKPPPKEPQYGIIIGYQVWCLDNSTGNHVNKTTDNTTLAITLGDLSPGMLYAIQVAAFTAATGLGTPSRKQFVQLDPIVSNMPHSVSLGDKIKSIVTNPKFIGPVGSVIWLALLIFCYFLYRRRKLKPPLLYDSIKLDNVNRQAGDTSTMSTRNCTMNQDTNTTWMEQSWQQNAAHYKTLTSQACCYPNGTAMGQSYPPNMLDGDGMIKENNIMPNDSTTNVFMTPDMITHNNIPEYAEVSSIPREMINPLDHKSLNVSGKEHNITQPYASTTLVMPPNIKDNLDKNYTGNNLDKPWLQPPYYNSKKRHDKMIEAENSGSSSCTLPSHLRMNDSCATSPVSDSGSYTQDSGGSGRRKKKVKSHKQPALNWADLLPPPPEHPPPPTDIDSPPDSPQYHVLGSPIPSQQSVKSSQGYQTDQQDESASIAASHRSHGSGGGRQYMHGGGNQGGHMPGIRRPQDYPMGPGMMMGGSLRKDQVNSPDNMRDMPMHSLNKKQRNMPPHGGHAGPHRELRHNPEYREIAVCNSVGLQNCESAIETDYTDNEDYPQDEHLIPMLPARLEDTPHGPGLSIDLPNSANMHNDQMMFSEISDAETSVKDEELDGDTESNCTGSMMASWASLDGSSGTSARCSAVSDSSDGSFFTDADFASAVAAAAESAGLKVEGTKVIDPNAGQRRMPVAQKGGHSPANPVTDNDSHVNGRPNKPKYSHKNKHPQIQQQQKPEAQHTNQALRNEQLNRNKPAKPAKPEKPEKPEKLNDRKGSHKKSQKSRQESEKQKLQRQHELQHELPQDDNIESDEVIPYSKPSFPSTSSSDTSSRGSTGRRKQERPYNPPILNDANDGVYYLQDTNDMGLRVTANPMAFEHDENNHFKA